MIIRAREDSVSGRLAISVSRFINGTYIMLLLVSRRLSIALRTHYANFQLVERWQFSIGGDTGGAREFFVALIFPFPHDVRTR